MRAIISVGYDTVGWRLSETDNLMNNRWQEVYDVEFTDDTVQHELMMTNSAGFFRLERPAKQ